MQKEPLRGFGPLVWRKHLLKIEFNFSRIRLIGQLESPRDAFDMSVDHDSRLAERISQDDVGGFLPTPGKVVRVSISSGTCS